jgi:hypothetical protein
VHDGFAGDLVLEVAVAERALGVERADPDHLDGILLAEIAEVVDWEEVRVVPGEIGPRDGDLGMRHGSARNEPFRLFVEIFQQVLLSGVWGGRVRCGTGSVGNGGDARFQLVVKRLASLVGKRRGIECRRHGGVDREHAVEVCGKCPPHGVSGLGGLRNLVRHWMHVERPLHRPLQDLVRAELRIQLFPQVFQRLRLVGCRLVVARRIAQPRYLPEHSVDDVKQPPASLVHVVSQQGRFTVSLPFVERLGERGGDLAPLLLTLAFVPRRPAFAAAERPIEALVRHQSLQRAGAELRQASVLVDRRDRRRNRAAIRRARLPQLRQGTFSGGARAAEPLESIVALENLLQVLRDALVPGDAEERLHRRLHGIGRIDAGVVRGDVEPLRIGLDVEQFAVDGP